MDTALGLLGMALWIVSVIALAAAITFVVVRLFPGGDDEAKPASES